MPEQITDDIFSNSEREDPDEVNYNEEKFDEEHFIEEN